MAFLEIRRESTCSVTNMIITICLLKYLHHQFENDPKTASTHYFWMTRVQGTENERSK